VLRVHRAEEIVAWHLPVERSHEASEPFFADEPIDILIVCHFISAR
jgi:hypothetical protein